MMFTKIPVSLVLLATGLVAQCAPTTLLGTAVPHPMLTTIDGRAIAQGDFNDDGIVDIATAGMTGSVAAVTVFMGAGSGGVGNGNFGGPTTFSAQPLSAPNAMVAADFDEDGILDLAVAGPITSSPVIQGAVRILLGVGSGGVGTGTFTPGALILAGFAPTEVITADFNEDGIADLLTADLSGTFSMMLGQGSGGIGNGTFGPPAPIATGATLFYDVVAADFDEDGILDLAGLKSGDGSPGWVSIFLGQGTGGVGSGAFALLTTVGLAASLNRSLIVGDFNEDGIFDLAATSPAGVDILIGLGTGGVGSGYFAQSLVPCGQYPWELANGDWNGDGIPDLAVARNTQAFFPDYNVSLLLGQGSGGVGTGLFTAVLGYNAMTGLPWRILAGDYDENGVPDLAVLKQVSSFAAMPGTCATSLPTTIAVTAPNGSEILTAGANTFVTWTKAAGITLVDVEVSFDGGANWTTIAQGLTDLHFDWTVTNPNSFQALIRVSDSTVPGRFDVSDGIFTIVGAHPAAVQSIGAGCGAGVVPAISLSNAEIGLPAAFSLTGANPVVMAHVYSSADTGLPPLVLGNGCLVHLDLGSLVYHGAFQTDASGGFALSLMLPAEPALVGTSVRIQAITETGVAQPPFELSNALLVTFGY